ALIIKVTCRPSEVSSPSPLTAPRLPSLGRMRSHYSIPTRRCAFSGASISFHGGQGASIRKRCVPVAAAAASQFPSASTSSQDPADVPELVSWVHQRNGLVHGATLANLAGRDGAAGWGLKASQDVEKGHRLILLPPSLHLTYGPQDDPRLLSLIDKVPKDLRGAKLALQLLAQRVRGSDSPFAEYIAHLPKGVSGIPMFFSKRAIQLIDYPPVSEQVKKRCKWLYDFSQQVLSKLPGTPEDPFGGVPIDINALGWAMACVTSRAFRTRGPAQPSAMLPLIDMANHSFEPNAEVLPISGGALGLFAKRKIAAMEPLLLSYGNLGNDFLFMDYGFIVPDNPYDSVQLRFDIGLLQAGCVITNVTDSQGAPLDLSPTPWRLAALSELRLHGPDANLELTLGAQQRRTNNNPASAGVASDDFTKKGEQQHTEELLDGRLLAAARIMVAKHEGEVAGRSADRLCAVDKPLSRENELAALRVVAGVVAVALSNFGTTLDQDLALLDGRVPEVADAEGASAESLTGQQGLLEPLTSEDEVLAVRF
ncbi:hypothetical protein Agub_g9781, partial [Astrephomene gubernaculifera]